MQRKKELGYDILKINEFLSLDLVKVAVDEAHRLGMPVAAHSWDVVGSCQGRRRHHRAHLVGRLQLHSLRSRAGASWPRIGWQA